MFDNIVKRIVDIILSITLLILFSPIILLTAIAVRLDSKGPILAETPERVGKNGRQFRMYKLRSMVKNAHEMLTGNPKYRRLYEEYRKSGYKLKHDPRVTRVGRLIRRFSIDEVPQLINVVRGEMSIVGPRAYYPDELEEQQKKFPGTAGKVKVVLSVRPGITGIWQVSGRSELDFEKRIQMDADYAKKRSLPFDLMIILKTPIAMLSGKGAM